MSVLKRCAGSPNWATPINSILMTAMDNLVLIWAFMAHGMLTYGFFAVVGTLGMTGVVINDAIVMIDLLESEVNKSMPLDFAHVSRVCTTRLRPIILTSLTTVAGIFPTAYGIAGYDSILAEMMLAMGWGLIFGTLITLVLVPCLYVAYFQIVQRWNRASA